MGGMCSTASRAHMTSGMPSRPSGARVVEPENSFAFVHDGAVYDVCRAEASATFFSCGEDLKLACLDARSGRVVIDAWPTEHSGLPTRLSYAPVTHTLASASRDRSVKLWRVDSASPTCSATLAGHDLTVSAVHWAAGGQLLASGSRDSTVRVWDAATQKAVLRVHRTQNLVTCLKWHPASPQSIVVQSGEDLRVRLWDTRVGKEVHILEGYTYFPLALDLSPDGQRLLTASKGFNGVGCEARVWDLRYAAATPAAFAQRPELLHQCVGHQQDTTGCGFLPEGALPGRGPHCFVTASKDGSVRVWDAETGEQLHVRSEVRASAFTSLAVLPGAHEEGEAPIEPAGADSEPRPSCSHAARPIVVASSYNSGIFSYSVGTDGALTCLVHKAGDAAAPQQQQQPDA